MPPYIHFVQEQVGIKLHKVLITTSDDPSEITMGKFYGVPASHISFMTTFKISVCIKTFVYQFIFILYLLIINIY